MTKPFGVPELMARERSLRARAPPCRTRCRCLTMACCTWIWRCPSPVGAGGRVTLTRKEFALSALLSVLLRNAGRVVTQPQLLRELWGPTHQQAPH